MGLACVLFCLLPVSGSGAIFEERRYGPTMPGGYYMRIRPSLITMSNRQRSQVTVTVVDAAGQPVDDVLVSFLPSEGEVTTGTSHTRGGEVTGTFTAATGGDQPRIAFIIVTVENVEATVFIEIVPMVFGH